MKKRNLVQIIFFVVIFVTLMSLLIFGVFFASDPSEIPSVLTGLPAENFDFTTFEGEKLSLKDFRGRPIILNFWASWCPPCKQDSAILINAYLKYKIEDAVFIGIAVGDTTSDAEKSARDLNKPFLLTMDSPNGSTSINYGVVGIPESFYIDKNFIIRQKIIGVNDPNALNQFLEKQLQ